jgi:hypothetical protein
VFEDGLIECSSPDLWLNIFERILDAENVVDFLAALVDGKVDAEVV